MSQEITLECPNCHKEFTAEISLNTMAVLDCKNCKEYILFFGFCILISRSIFDNKTEKEKKKHLLDKVKELFDNLRLIILKENL